MHEARYTGHAPSGMEPELAHEYRSLSEIASASPNIVIVTIETRVDEPFSNVPFSAASARIEAVVSGGLVRGQLIPVVESGGLFAGRSEPNPGEVGQPAEVGLDGVPVMKPGERWLLFLTGQTQVGPRQEAYAVSGAMQGKLLIGSDNRIAFSAAPGTTSRGSNEKSARRAASARCAPSPLRSTARTTT